MTQLLDFCSKCGARRLRNVKKKLQDLFESRADLEENVCWICRKVIGQRRGRKKKKAAEETTITWELKTEPADVPVGQETLQAIANLESDNVPAETETLQVNRNLESDDDFAEPIEANDDEDSEGPPEVKKEFVETEVADENTGDADTVSASFGTKKDKNHDKNERKSNSKRSPKSNINVVKTEKSTTEKEATFEDPGAISRRTTRLRTGAIKAKTVASFDKQVYGLESDDDEDEFSDEEEARDNVWDPESEESDKEVGKRKKDKTSGLEEKVKVTTAADMALLLASVYNKPEDVDTETDPDAPSLSKKKDSEPTRAYLELKALRPEVLEVMGKFEDEEVPYQCKFCNHKPYTAVTHLMKHVAEKHTRTEPITKPFLCKTSGKYFEKIWEWYQHTQEKPFKCKHSGCKKSFTHKHNLLCHYIGHGEARPFPCEQCDSSFKFKNALKKHVKTVHDQIKDHICRFCGRTFSASGNLKIHERLHTNDLPFKCQQCDKAYHTKQSLRDHLMDHTGERPFVCETCGYRTKNKNSLKIHLEIHMASTDKPWKCGWCGKQFKGRRHLRTHKAQVHDERHKCRFCDKKFSYKSTCEQHEKGHPEWTGVRKFVCKVCGRDCHEKNKLTEHMRSHTKEKPFHCTHCSYSTSLKRNLDTHMRRHTGEKPYRCPTCDMRFMYYQPCKDHQKNCNQAAGTSGNNSRVNAGNNSSGGQASRSSSGQVEVKSEVKTEITEALRNIAEVESASGQGVVTQVLPIIPNIGGQDYMLL